MGGWKIDCGKGPESVNSVQLLAAAAESMGRSMCANECIEVSLVLVTSSHREAANKVNDKVDRCQKNNAGPQSGPDKCLYHVAQS